jgi:Kef-type K+ transport system membrane component KefB
MMPEISLSGVLIVAAVAFAVPLVLGLAPMLRLPSVVLEIVAGIVIGPAVLGLAEVDEPLRILALIGLAFLLFLAGLEIDLNRLLHGGALRSSVTGFVLTLVIAFAAALGLAAAGLIHAPLLVAIMLSATSLGIVVPVLTDAGQSGTTLGQLIIAASSVADFGAVILLSLFFSGEGSSVGSTLLLIVTFIVLVVAIGVALAKVERFGRVSSVLQRLQDTSAQIRVRGALVFLIGFAVLAQSLGLEVILGAFIAGAVLRLIDRDEMMTHTFFHQKLEAVGFGVFIPFFFVTSGMLLDVRALFSGGAALAPVPVFLLALLFARGLPAVLYRSQTGTRGVLAAGLLQATSLPFIVATAMIGMQLGLLNAATGAALVVAGLLSVLIFPICALTLLKAGERLGATEAEAEK